MTDIEFDTETDYQLDRSIALEEQNLEWPTTPEEL